VLAQLCSDGPQQGNQNKDIYVYMRGRKHPSITTNWGRFSYYLKSYPHQLRQISGTSQDLYKQNIETISKITTTSLDQRRPHKLEIGKIIETNRSPEELIFGTDTAQLPNTVNEKHFKTNKNI
jgi:hypothetical protein